MVLLSLVVLASPSTSLVYFLGLPPWLTSQVYPPGLTLHLTSPIYFLRSTFPGLPPQVYLLGLSPQVYLPGLAPRSSSPGLAPQVYLSDLPPRSTSPAYPPSLSPRVCLLGSTSQTLPARSFLPILTYSLISSPIYLALNLHYAPQRSASRRLVSLPNSTATPTAAYASALAALPGALLHLCYLSYPPPPPLPCELCNCCCSKMFSELSALELPPPLLSL